MDSSTAKQVVNTSAFSLDAKSKALGGIENPVIGYIPANSILYRFGSNQRQAMDGAWWFGQEQFNQITELAALNALAFPHAARVLSAVLHAYNEFTHLLKVRTTAALACYQGESLKQVGKLPMHSGEVVRERMAKVTVALSKPFLQFYIPGLDNQDIRSKALDARMVFSVFAAEESHLFGTRGAPKGALLQ